MVGPVAQSRLSEVRSRVPDCPEEAVIALESWEGLGPQEAFKKDSQGLSCVGAQNLLLGEGGKIWENGIETCKISCMK